MRSDWPELDTILNELLDEDRMPGMSLLFIKEGEICIQEGIGFSDLELRSRVDPVKTIFRSASASKPIAATALAIMVSKGIVDLDSSFYDYVPYFPKKAYDFTLRQLASHTAGIRGYKGKEYALNKPYTIKESIEIFKDDPLLFQPATSYLYNSFDWVLISLAMQEASGIPFEDFVKSEVLDPLDMRNTVPEIPDENLINKAKFYTKTAGGFRKAVSVDNRYKIAGGGYLTTASDLAKLGLAYLNQTLIDPAVTDQFIEPQIINGKSTYYGLGWEVSQDKSGRAFFGHTGNSVGGYSNFYIYPHFQAIVVILINCTDPKIQPELDQAISYFLSAEPMV